MADLIREVDVARRVDEVQAVGEPIASRVVEPDRACLDRDALLALEVHRVEDLARHLPRVDRVGQLEQPVGKRRLAVIDVGNDREVAHARLWDGTGTFGGHADDHHTKDRRRESPDRSDARGHLLDEAEPLRCFDRLGSRPRAELLIEPPRVCFDGVG